MSQLGIPGVRQPPIGRDELDRDYTPAFLAYTLTRLLPVEYGIPGSVVEPSVGGGAFARAIADIHDIRPQGFDLDEAAAGRQDCHFECRSWLEVDGSWQWAIGNPPYGDAELHIRHALKNCRNVAFLLRLAFLESSERIPFWEEFPARKVWVLAQRPSFRGGATDSCAYGWFHWDRDHDGPTELEVLSWR